MNVSHLKSWTYFTECVFGLGMVPPNKNTYTKRRIDFALDEFSCLMANYRPFYDSISPTSESLGKQPGNLEIMLGNSYHKTSLKNTVLWLMFGVTAVSQQVC